MLTSEDGRQRRRELSDGSTYPSQSTRRLELREGVMRAVVHQARGAAER